MFLLEFGTLLAPASEELRFQASTPNIAPTVAITAPPDGSSFTEGDPINFAGSASDPEDGPLTGASLVWTSDIDGQIGTGESFVRDDLSVGTHTITLTATDSQGAAGSQSIQITVNLPDTTPPALITDFQASDGNDSQVNLTWTNPTDSDLAEVLVKRKTASYPADHTDGTTIYNNTSPIPGRSVSTSDTGLSNGLIYYYAVFSQDLSGNWNDQVEAGNNANTGIPSWSYFEDFEAGLGGWTKEEGGTTGSVMIVVSPNYPVYSGEQSVRQFAYAPDPNNIQNGATITFPAPSSATEYTLQLWIYVKQRTDAFASSTLGFIFPGGGVGWNVWGDNGSYVYTLGSDLHYKPVGLTKNAWHHVKVTYYSQDATLSIWVDGSKLHDRVSINILPGTSPSYFSINAGALNRVGDVIEQYIDDVTVSTP